MKRPIRILMQTTIPPRADDWSIERFSLLQDYLSSLRGSDGRPVCQVMARDRDADARGNDPVLSRLDSSEFDELWLFAADDGDGLSTSDCKGILRFRERGGSILATRDHPDLGASLRGLGEVGAAHVFHTRNVNRDSGRNGDFQRITPVLPLHDLLRHHTEEVSPGKRIEFFPAHPHEGEVCVPHEAHPASKARVIAMGQSLITGSPFNLIVAMEGYVDASGQRLGRVIADSSFHHFADYNWDPRRSVPSFVTERPGDEALRISERLSDIQAFTRNVALWLAGRDLADTTPSARMVG